MIIVKGKGNYGDEFFAMGETVKDALEALSELCEDLEFYNMTFFDAKQIGVAKTVEYKIIET